MTLPLKLYLTTIILMTSVSAQCPKGDYCTLCSPVLNHIFEMDCTLHKYVGDERFIIKFHPYEWMRIICDNAADWSFFHLGEKEKLPSMESLTFTLCELPKNRTLGDVVRQFIETDIKSLDYQSFKNITMQLRRETLSDFKAIDKLVLANNNLTEVPVDLLQDLVNLRHLDMSFNRLRELPNGFLDLPELEFLDLSYNELELIEPGLFQKLQNLKTLRLEFNKLTKLGSGISSELRSLTHLNIAENDLEGLSDDFFGQLKALKVVDLSRNNFTDEGIPPNLFRNNSLLESVTFDNNKQDLLSLPNRMFSDLKNLITVSLNGNRFVELPGYLFARSTNLQNISLARNKIQKIPEDLLQNLERIRILELAENEITDLPSNMFNALSKLEILDVSQNRLKEFSNGILDFMASLKVLNLANNQIEKIKSEGYCTIFKGFDDDFHFDSKVVKKENPVNNKGVDRLSYCAKNIHRVYLHGNKIQHIPRGWIFPDELELVTLHDNRITNLTMTDMRFYTGNTRVTYGDNLIETISFDGGKNFGIYASSLEVDLGTNSINCDCRLHDFLRFRDGEIGVEILSKLTFDISQLSCAQPRGLKNILIKKLDRISLKCLVEDSNNLNATCPKKCDCWQRPEDRYYLIDCSYRKLTKAPESLQSPEGYHIQLNLTGNLIKHMPLMMQSGYQNVTKLILSNNNISTVNLASLSKNLEMLTLNSNHLTKLDPDVLDFFKNSTRLVHLELHENPWICNCDTVDILRFIQAQIPKIPDLRKVTCESSEYPIFAMAPEDICPVFVGSIITIGSIVAIMGIFIGIIAAVYYRYQHEIKVWLYAKQWCLWFVTEDELDKDKEYDAFVSFSQVDALFVTEILLPTLEEGPHAFNLCVHYRDWIPGEPIPDQIANSVKDSKRTIIILSPDYLESVWSRIEFRAAHEQALNEGRARVIIILLADIESLENLDSEMQAYLSMNTYVKWGDPWFWEKLNYALPHPDNWLRKKKKCKNIDLSDPRVQYFNNKNATDSNANVTISI